MSNPFNYLDDIQQSGSIEINLAGMSGSVFLSDTQVKQHLLKLTGALTGNTTLYFPASAVGNTFVIDNATTGGFTVSVMGRGTVPFALSSIGAQQVYYDSTNFNLEDATASKAPRGNLALVGGGTDIVLTTNQFNNNSFDITGTLTANINVIIPDGIPQTFIVDNGTTGAFSITVKHNATAGVVVGQGTRVILYTTGTLVEPVTASGAGGGGHIIQEETTILPSRANLNFRGVNITASDDGLNTTNVEAVIVPVRQTVLYSPVDTAGLPTFLPATSASLVLTIQNVTGTDYLEMTASQRSADVIGRTTTNSLSWTCGASSGTNYLPVAVALGGVLTAQTPVTLAPIYQWGGTPAVTNGQYTFNIQQMTMFLGNGTSAPAVNHVIIGECVAGATTITSTVAYALQGRYYGDIATLAANTNYTLNTNMGISPEFCITRKWLYCKTAELGYTIGQRAYDTQDGNAGTGTNWYGIASGVTNNVASFRTHGGIGVVRIDSSSLAGFTVANWGMEFMINRGF